MEEYEYNEERKSIKGYQIVIVILALILAALSYLYFHQTSSMKADFAVEKDTLTNQLSRLAVDLDNLKIDNDTITQNLAVERGRADSLLESLQQERNLSRAKIRKYEKELGTLRTVMRGFVQTIDSLNTLNNKLLGENVRIRKEIATERLRGDMAEEKASELEVKVRKGSVVQARNINLLALSSSDKEVTRASRAARLRVDFVLSANELANPGERNVYAVITGPEKYVMANAGGAVFEVEGDRKTYSAVREIDYQGHDLSVSLYYTGGGITSGTYQVAIYMDGMRIGANEVILK